MKADTLDLTAVFGKDIRYVVPLYQRPYVWNMKDHWEPLWNDVQALAEQIEALAAGDGQSGGLRKAPPPHFLGALVVEQLSTPVGEIEARQVIDGQQRLTTLQLLILAARRVADAHSLDRHERLLGRLIDNNADLVRAPEHAFKVWPTNADRDVFRAVLKAEALVDFGERTSLKIANAAAYFEKVITGWLEGLSATETESKMEALTTAIRSHMRVVAIDLDNEDNAQVIFETLNARGTPLLAADLIKNVVFQRALAEGAEPEHLYRDYWAPFDTDLWRVELRQGRLVRPRLDIFMGHWLAMKNGSEVLIHQLFPVFKDYLATHQQGAGAVAQELFAAAKTFDSFERFPWDSVEGRFFARQRLLDVSTTLPFLVFLFGLPKDVLDSTRRASVLIALESYLVRRTVCRLTTKRYNLTFLDLLARVRQDPGRADVLAIDHLRSLTGESQYWPKDDEVTRALLEEPLYVKLPRTRVRLVLEGLEWALRTEKGEKVKLFETLQIEHVLPQEWEKEKWPLADDVERLSPSP